MPVKADFYDDSAEQCMDHIRDTYPTKRIELMKGERLRGSKAHYMMSGSCFEPVCSTPHSWFVYEVKYIEGRKVPITCTITKGEDPVLSLYPEADKLAPPS